MARRRGAAGGAGELETVGGGVGFVSEAVDRGEVVRSKRPSTFWRLWAEAKQEKGHLTLAGVCLLASSSANLVAPAILAK